MMKKITLILSTIIIFMFTCGFSRIHTLPIVICSINPDVDDTVHDNSSDDNGGDTSEPSEPSDPSPAQDDESQPSPSEPEADNSSSQESSTQPASNNPSADPGPSGNSDSPASGSDVNDTITQPASTAQPASTVPLESTTPSESKTPSGTVASNTQNPNVTAGSSGTGHTSHNDDSSDSTGGSCDNSAWQASQQAYSTASTGAMNTPAVTGRTVATTIEKASSPSTSIGISKKKSVKVKTIIEGIQNGQYVDITKYFDNAGRISRYVPSNGKICYVGSDGHLYATRSGTVTISGQERIKFGKYKTIETIEIAIDIPAMIDSTVSVGEYDAFKMLDNADDLEITNWKSSREEIAHVDKNGKITCKSPGTVLITAYTADGGKLSARLTVK